LKRKERTNKRRKRERKKERKKDIMPYTPNVTRIFCHLTKRIFRSKKKKLPVSQKSVAKNKKKTKNQLDLVKTSFCFFLKMNGENLCDL
jgi:hypothetical protein